MRRIILAVVLLAGIGAVGAVCVAMEPPTVASSSVADGDLRHADLFVALERCEC